jgi:hypothetical protein
MPERNLIYTVLILGIFCSFVFCCNSEEKSSQKENDLEEENLLGRVQVVTESAYEGVEEFGKIEKGDLERTTISKYDKRGNKIEYVQYNNDSSVYISFKQTFDEKGNLVEDILAYTLIELDRKRIYKYDDKGIRIESTNYNAKGRAESKTIYKYDDRGNLSQLETYLPNGRLRDKHEWIYPDCK